MKIELYNFVREAVLWMIQHNPYCGGQREVLYSSPVPAKGGNRFHLWLYSTVMVD